MAQKSTDFSEYTAGSAPADWTAGVGNPANSIVTDGTAPGGKRLDISQTSGRNSTIYWDDLTAEAGIGDVEIVAMFANLGGFAGYYDGDGLRVGQSMGYPWHGYLAALTNEGGPGVVGLYLYEDGGATNTQAATLPTTGQRWWMRLRVNTTSSYVKVWWWLDGDTPKTNTDTPILSFASEATWLPPTYAGIETDGGSSHTLSCYYFAYGTAGDAAPLPASGPTGSGSITMPATEVSGTGERSSGGSGAIALDVIAVAGAGTRGVNGAGALSLDPVVVSGTSERSITGTSALTTDAVSVSGTGTAAGATSGSGALVLDPLTVAGTGLRTVNVAGNVVLSPAEVSGTGKRTVTGAGAVTLDALLVSGAGSVSGAISGAGTIEISATQVSGAGLITRAGGGALLLDAVTVAGVGVRRESGAGALLLDAILAAGAGVVSGASAGAGALTLDPVAVAGTGVRTSSALGAIVLAGVEVAGAGSVAGETAGSGALVVEAVQVAGLGTRIVTGTGAIDLTPILVVGAGVAGDLFIDDQTSITLPAYGSVTIYGNGVNRLFTLN